MNVTYHVGSANEDPQYKGFAHLFEHLMFAGSENVPAGGLSAELGALGAAPNAMTDFDFTTYFATVPVGALERTLWLEADRMGGMLAALDQKTLDIERDIVKNERRQTMESVPFGLLWEKLYQELFEADHPYHWVPMGSMAHLEAASLEEVRSFFTQHYGPNNAVLTIVGDVEAEPAFDLAERYFGGIPSNPIVGATPEIGVELLEAEKTIVMSDPMPIPAAVAAYRIPGKDSPDWAPLQVLGRILAFGEASRLGEQLVLEGYAQEVRAEPANLASGTDVFTAGMWLTEGADLEQCRVVRDREIERFFSEVPSEEEIERAKASIERSLYSAISTRGGLADLIGREEFFSPGNDPVALHLERTREVTGEDIIRSAKTWLLPTNRVEIVYHGENSEEPTHD